MIHRRRLAALGAALATATAVCTATMIAPVMTAAPARAASAGTGTGYLHTSGSKILDSTGATVRLTGLNWFGMETDNKTFHGLWASVTWKDQLDHMAQLGYNTIRVPFSGDALKSGAKATGINDYVNPDLIGLSPLEILDRVVDHAGRKGMRILLDRHRPSSGGQTPLWYTASVSEASMIADWEMLAKHYAGNTTVIGADLFNEPHAEGTAPNGTGACWGCGDPERDWRLAAQRIGNAILKVQPKWLIVVEGVSCPSGGSPNVWDSEPDDPMECGWWGGNLSAAKQYPVKLDVADQLVYSAHEYGISVYDRQPWFKESDFPNNLPAVWDHFWGYLQKENTAPVLIGEFGSTLADPLDTQWLTKLMSYMGSGTSGMSFTYWSWNPNSGDTGGIVGDDWQTVNQAKQKILSPYLVPPVPTSGPDPTGGPTTTPTQSTRTCTAALEATNTWDDGFQGEVTVTAGTSAITGWTVSWKASDGLSVQQAWSGDLVSSEGTVTVKNLAWNGALKAGASTTFGFQALGTMGSPTLTCTAS